MKTTKSKDSLKDKKPKTSNFLHQKIKPVVVKHILKDQIAPLAD